MAKFTGIVVVALNGQTVRSKPGAEMLLSTPNRIEQIADYDVVGYHEEPKAAMVSGSVAHNADFNIWSMAMTTDAKVTFETDTGEVWVLAHAWHSGDCRLRGQGEGATFEFKASRSTLA